MEEEDEIQAESCKFPRVGDENGDQLLRRRGGGGSDGSTNNNKLHSWHHHSSRIIRVSRASGGKDRHSKVMTSKGLRDRRVRLSVTTAIQFYDLQDRLGYDQPSKAVEWLIKSAADAIAELPSLNNTFPETPKQASNEKKEEQEQVFDDSADAGIYQQNNQSQNPSLSKSACSSTSETSKGSGLSLSRSDIRVSRIKARERARERAAKEKEKEKEIESSIVHHQNVNPISQTASFTELLTGGINTTNGSVHQNHTSPRHQWCSTVPMDYFSSGLLGASSSSRTHHQLGHSFTEAMSVSPYNVVAGENHSSDQLQQHFLSFIPDHLIPAVVTSPHPVAGSGDYNLNFTISSSSLGLAGGYNNNNSRGTLQSNSPSLLPPHMQRFSSQTIDGSSSSSTVPFFIGGAAAAAAAAAAVTPAPADATPLENHHHQQHQIQFSPVFDGRGLQLYYGDETRHSDHKGKAKN